MELARTTQTTFAAYLAKYYVAKKGFTFGAVPEARDLEAACNFILTFSDNLNFRIICIVDCEADPDSRFDVSPEIVSQIAEQCRKYTGRIAYSKMPVVIDIFEIGPNSIAAPRQDRLKQLATHSIRAKVNISAWIVDTSSLSVWTSAPFNGLLRGRLLIQRLLRAPRLAETDLQPVVALAQASRIPIATYCLLAVLVAVYVGECISGLGSTSILSPTVRTLLALGGLSWNAAVEQHEWYRLLSATFLHADVMHLLLNCIALFYAAIPIERLLGRAWFSTIYAISALGGSMMSLALNTPNIVSVGASGAIMGLFTAGLVCSYRFPPGINRTQLGSNALPVLIPSLLPLTATTTSGHIDFGAHLGGALSGGLVGAVVLVIWPRTMTLPRFRPIATLMSIAALLAALGALVPIMSEYDKASQAGTLSAILIPEDRYPRSLAEGKAQSEKLVASYPRDPRAHFYRSSALLERHDFDGAVRELRTALDEHDILKTLLPSSLEPTLQLMLAAALADRASTYKKSGDLDRALADYNEIIKINIYGRKLDPKAQDVVAKIRPFYRRGQILFDKGDIDSAVADYDHAIKLDPKDAAVWNSRCWARAIAGRELYQALSDCNESLRLRPNDADTLDSRGFVHLKSGAFEKAIADYDAALKIAPKKEESLYGRGLAKEKTGDPSGNADIMMAKAIRAGVVEEFERYGIK